MLKTEKLPLAFLVLLILALSACSAQTANPGASDVTELSAAESESASETEPALPAEDWEGAAFTFLVRLTNYAYDETYVYTESYDGEVVNDAILDRNRAVEEKYGIKFAATYDGAVSATAQKSIAAGEYAFDAMWDSKNAMPALITGGYLVDFNTVPYLSLTANYWDANAASQLAVLKRLYFMPCDISMQNLTGARFLYFNKKLIDDYSLDNPYELVYSNSWTLDAVLGMIKAVSADLNGDGVMDSGDRYGLLSENGSANGNILYFINSAGIRDTENDADGVPHLSCVNETTIKIMEMCKEVLGDPKVAITYENASKGADIGDYPHYFAYCRGALFAADHFLFVQAGIYETVTFKNMESDYGVAPNPKYDASQKNYSHRIDPYTTIMAIPITNPDLEKTGIILEYMSWLSSKTVFPAYYETTIKTKRVRDDDAPKIIDIVKNSISYEISDIFDLGVTGMLWEGYSSGNLSSVYAKKESAIQAKLDKLVEDIGKILS